MLFRRRIRHHVQPRSHSSGVGNTIVLAVEFSRGPRRHPQAQHLLRKRAWPNSFCFLRPFSRWQNNYWQRNLIRVFEIPSFIAQRFLLRKLCRAICFSRTAHAAAGRALWQSLARAFSPLGPLHMRWLLFCIIFTGCSCFWETWLQAGFFESCLCVVCSPIISMMTSKIWWTEPHSTAHHALSPITLFTHKHEMSSSSNDF